MARVTSYRLTQVTCIAIYKNVVTFYENEILFFLAEIFLTIFCLYYHFPSAQDPDFSPKIPSLKSIPTSLHPPASHSLYLHRDIHT
jgi:hypothetical protein